MFFLARPRSLGESLPGRAHRSITACRWRRLVVKAIVPRIFQVPVVADREGIRHAIREAHTLRSTTARTAREDAETAREIMAECIKRAKWMVGKLSAPGDSVASVRDEMLAQAQQLLKGLDEKQLHWMLEVCAKMKMAMPEQQAKVPLQPHYKMFDSLRTGTGGAHKNRMHARTHSWRGGQFDVHNGLVSCGPH